jgi:hypothetical protein
MNFGRTIFAQVMDFLPKKEFAKCVQRYEGNKRVRSFTCWDQFLCMAFAQLTYRESLRDIEACLRAVPNKRYHMGIKGNIARSTIAEANESRDWRIYADFAQVLISRARGLYADEDFGVDINDAVYALDSTTIDLCLSLFPWANFRKTKGAVKLHTLLDLNGSIPSWVVVTDGKVHDVNILDYLLPEAGSFYVMDRGYLDFSRLYKINLSQAFFVIRAKTNTKFQRQYSAPVDRSTGITCDQTGILTGFYTVQGYPEKLRRIKFNDDETGKTFVFLTNNFHLPAFTITQLYKCRWKVELFFKWIKQHLRIKAFYGTSENAVKTQIWIAISIYVLVAILKKRLKIDSELYTILQILSLFLFEKIPLYQLLMQTPYTSTCEDPAIQLKLFTD